MNTFFPIAAALSLLATPCPPPSPEAVLRSSIDNLLGMTERVLYPNPGQADNGCDTYSIVAYPTYRQLEADVTRGSGVIVTSYAMGAFNPIVWENDRLANELVHLLAPRQGRHCTAVVHAANFEQLGKTLASWSGHCKGCIRELSIDGHGSPGSMVANDAAGVPERERLLVSTSMLTAVASTAWGDKLPGLFADGAKVRFMGCNVGKGPSGEEFIRQAGHTLLRKRGGRVSALVNTGMTNMAALSVSMLNVSQDPAVVFDQSPDDGGGTISHLARAYDLPIPIIQD